MAHQNDKFESLIFTPLDWQLLRKCPCPVWMVKDKVWPEQGSVVVGVNLSNEESYHDALNLKLVSLTQDLAKRIVKDGNPSGQCLSGGAYQYRYRITGF